MGHVGVREKDLHLYQNRGKGVGRGPAAFLVRGISEEAVVEKIYADTVPFVTGKHVVVEVVVERLSWTDPHALR